MNTLFFNSLPPLPPSPSPLTHRSKVFALKDIITGNPTVIKMVIHFTRSESEGGHTVLRELLAPLVQEILAKEDLVLNTSPVDVYKSWINQMESETGEKS